MCVFEGTGCTSESESEELEEEEEEESLELSEAMPVDSWRSTLSARVAMSGLSCFRILREILCMKINTLLVKVSGSGCNYIRTLSLNTM